jgi:hypothetical protein
MPHPTAPNLATIGPCDAQQFARSVSWKYALWRILQMHQHAAGPCGRLAEELDDGRQWKGAHGTGEETRFDIFVAEPTPHVSRFWDAPHKSLVYVVWTDRLINGSPQNSISAVVAEPWGNQAPDLSLIGPAAAAPPQ